MICRDCKIAGSNARFYRNADGTITKHTRKMVMQEHGLCRGGTWCDCQHAIPEVIRNKKKNSPGT